MDDLKRLFQVDPDGQQEFPEKRVQVFDDLAADAAAVFETGMPVGSPETSRATFAANTACRSWFSVTG